MKTELPDIDKVLGFVKKALLDTYYAALEGGYENAKEEIETLKALLLEAGEVVREVAEGGYSQRQRIMMKEKAAALLLKIQEAVK